VVDRHPGQLGQHPHRLLIGLDELRATLLLGQIQVPERLAVHTTGTPRSVFIGGCSAGKP
jgi:hypothetical protein